MKPVVRVLFVVVLVALPLIAAHLYSRISAYPPSIRIATGLEGGRYRVLMENLGHEIEKQLDVEIEFVPTTGARQNTHKLRDGEVHFALYQSGSQQFTGDNTSEGTTPQITFVSNMYSELSHILVRVGSGIESLSRLDGVRVALGPRETANLEASRVLLRHLGQAESQLDQRSLFLTYDEVAEAFNNESLDVAFIQTGIQSPIVSLLVANKTCVLFPVPNTDAFAIRNVAFSNFIIPQGYYCTGDTTLPQNDINTVALTAQLLTRADVHSGLVEEVTRIVNSQEFIIENELVELFEKGKEFGLRKPEFSLHQGAMRYYSPELKPFISPEFIDATEGIRSLLFSIVIAIVIAFGWMRQKLLRNREHQMDRYIFRLMHMEQAQLKLDADPEKDDIGSLQDALDEITILRQEALSEFTAHQLNEDRSIDSFLEMSHALGAKINEKLTRQRLERRMDELGKKMTNGG